MSIGKSIDQELKMLRKIKEAKKGDVFAFASYGKTVVVKVIEVVKEVQG
jgi:hypothetical protein